MRDEEIIAMYFARQEAAIEATEEKYGSYCYQVAENILHSSEDSQECLNDTWLRAWNSIPPQKPTRLKLFLAKITRNLAFDRFKARTAEKRGGCETALILDELSQCIPSGESAEQRLQTRELRESINAFVHTLPERERNVFLRRYFFAESIRQISACYHLTENHVSVLLSRCRKKLKAHLMKEGYFI